MVFDNPQYQKMITGQEYNCFEPELNQLWQRQQALNHQTNLNPDTNFDSTLLPHIADSAMIMKPLFISYGLHLHLDEQVFINVNCTLQDNAPITIGKQTMLGPNVQLYTASHPLEAQPRAQGLETAKAITIGERVWVGGGAIILPGVTIENEAVIAAGSVVTKDVKAKQVVAGNPAREIKTLE